MPDTSGINLSLRIQKNVFDRLVQPFRCPKDLKVCIVECIVVSCCSLTGAVGPSLTGVDTEVGFRKVADDSLTLRVINPSLPLPFLEGKKAI